MKMLRANSLRFATLLVLALLASVSVSAAPRSDAEIEQAVRSILMDRHPSEGASWWTGLGPSAPAVIMKLYESEPSSYRRMRLIEGLSAFVSDASALEFIKNQADRTPEDVIRNHVIRMVGRHQGAKEEEWLSKFLGHSDPHTRVAAVRAVKAAGTPDGLRKVEKWMSEEKVSWAVAQAKGEVSQPGAPLAPSGISEDRLSVDFEGQWQGYWVSPDRGHGMLSEAVKAEFQLSGLRAVGGRLSVKSKTGIRVLSLARAEGKANRWSGALVEKGKPGEVLCEAELLRQAGHTIAQIRFPQSASIMILRRIK